MHTGGGGSSHQLVVPLTLAAPNCETDRLHNGICHTHGDEDVDFVLSVKMFWVKNVVFPFILQRKSLETSYNGE